MTKPRYSLRPTSTPLPSQEPRGGRCDPSGTGPSPHRRNGEAHRAFLRPEGEDDDGYDPYSDRPADLDPDDAEDPWR